VILFFLQINTSKAVICGPNVATPLAVVEIIAPVDVLAIKKVAVVGAVVAVFERIGDWAAVE